MCVKPCGIQVRCAQKEEAIKTITNILSNKSLFSDFSVGMH